MLSTGGVARTAVSPAQQRLGRGGAAISSSVHHSRPRISLPIISSSSSSPSSSSFEVGSVPKNSGGGCSSGTLFGLASPQPLFLPSPLSFSFPFALGVGSGLHHRTGNHREWERRLREQQQSRFDSDWHLQKRGGWKKLGSSERTSIKAVVASVDDPKATKLNQKPLHDELQRYGLEESDYDITGLNVVGRQESNFSVVVDREVGRSGMPRKRKASSKLTVDGVKQEDKPTLKDEAGVVEDWCAYLLVSGDMKKTYVGVTYDIRRRLRQHNGEIAGGAKSARAGRPWRLVCTVRGFENRSEACQFEWTWKSTTAKVKVLSKADSKRPESPLIARRRATLAKVIDSKEEWAILDVQWRDE